MKYGYARISTIDQNADMQIKALQKAGCKKLLPTSLPARQLTALPCAERGVQFRSLTEEISTTTPGGTLVFHIFAALAQFERGLISSVPAKA
ncbi:MAG: recombinase family protein [Bryobacteraceae bacterium]